MTAYIYPYAPTWYIAHITITKTNTKRIGYGTTHYKALLDAINH